MAFGVAFLDIAAWESLYSVQTFTGAEIIIKNYFQIGSKPVCFSLGGIMCRIYQEKGAYYMLSKAFHGSVCSRLIHYQILRAWLLSWRSMGDILGLLRIDKC